MAPSSWSAAVRTSVRISSRKIRTNLTYTDDALVSLQQWRENIRVIPQLIQNDVSSTKIRLFRKRGKSIRYYIPDKVVDYIHEHDLYVDDNKKQSDKGKEKEIGESAS